MYNYPIKGFGFMIAPTNKHRVDAYVRAIQQTVTSDSVVFEIGTGVGFFALLACKSGARHVYAIDPNPAVQVGRELAADNGCADRITFLEGMSTAIELPERADVIVSDIRGTLPWLADNIPSIKDARQRHLKPGGVLIPGRDTVWAAVVHAPQHYARNTAAWDDNWYGLDLDAARRRTVSNHRKGHVEASNLLTRPQCWATLDYYTIEDTNAQGTLDWTADRPGTAHGISVWFESELVPGVPLSNAPDQPHNPVYSQSFFPWSQPVDLVADDDVEVQIRTRRIDNKYQWQWITLVTSAEGEKKARFQQSTFDGQIWSANTLRRRAPMFAPNLNAKGEIDRFVLNRMDGQCTLDTIAKDVTERFPNRFDSPQEALSLVTGLSERYGE